MRNRQAAVSHTEGIALPKPLPIQPDRCARDHSTTPRPLGSNTTGHVPRQLTVRRNVLTPNLGHLCRVEVAANFGYAGGQRFILQSVADAETGTASPRSV